MPRYKLRIPDPGTWLYGDGDTAVVAATREEALGYWGDYYGDDIRYVHSEIGRCRIAYKADVDGGDVPQDTEPGDTIVDYCRDDGHELRDGEIRVWLLGPPPPPWRMEPLPWDEITADLVPVGTHCYHRRLGWGKIAAPGYLVGRRWWIDVDWGWPDPKNRKACAVGTVSINEFRPRRFRLTVNGEHIGDGTNEELYPLRERRIAELDEAWKAQYDEELQRAA